MTWWQICLLIFLILWLLGRIRVGGDVEYSSDGIRIRIRLGAFHIKVFPPKKQNHGSENRKKSGQKKEKHEKPKAETPKQGGGLEHLKQYISLGCEAAGALLHRIRIEALNLDLTLAGGDAASMALAFGGAHAVFGMLWPVLEQNFDVREHRFRSAVDFQGHEMKIYGFAAFSARIGQLISFTIRYGILFLKLLRANRKPVTTKKEAI